MIFVQVWARADNGQSLGVDLCSSPILLFPRAWARIARTASRQMATKFQGTAFAFAQAADRPALSLAAEQIRPDDGHSLRAT